MIAHNASWRAKSWVQCWSQCFTNKVQDISSGFWQSISQKKWSQISNHRGQQLPDKSKRKVLQATVVLWKGRAERSSQLVWRLNTKFSKTMGETKKFLTMKIISHLDDIRDDDIIEKYVDWNRCWNGVTWSCPLHWNYELFHHLNTFHASLL